MNVIFGVTWKLRGTPDFFTHQWITIKGKHVSKLEPFLRANPSFSDKAHMIFLMFRWFEVPPWKLVSWHLTRGCSWCSAKQAASTSRNLKPGTNRGPWGHSQNGEVSGEHDDQLTNHQVSGVPNIFGARGAPGISVILSVPITRKQIYHKSITQKIFPAAAASLQKQLGPHPPCASSCQPGHWFLALNIQGIMGTLWWSRKWKVPKVTRSCKCFSYSGW